MKFEQIRGEINSHQMDLAFSTGGLDRVGTELTLFYFFIIENCCFNSTELFNCDLFLTWYWGSPPPDSNYHWMK